MRILLLVTRDPTGPPTGRSTSIGTLVSSLLELGHEVDIAVIADSIGDRHRWPATVTLHRISPPPLRRWALNVAWRATWLRLSLNECLYFSPRLVKQVRDIAARQQCGLVIADMIRTFEVARATGLPMILDLDDLLSLRYGRMITGGGRTEEIFGYFPVPRVLAPLLQRLATRLLNVETFLLRRREVVAAGQVPVSCVVSPAEAALLASRVGHKIWVAPMAVRLPARTARAAEGGIQARQAAFAGGLDYGPNLDAALWFKNEVLPAWRARGLGELQLHLFGRCPDNAGRLLQDPQIVLRGFVPDLFSELVSFPVFAAPMTSGGGVKTKVVEAMAAGLPVVSTSAGVEGIDVDHGDGCLVADDPGEFAEALHRIFADPEMGARLAGRARHIANRDFDPSRRTRRWGEMIAEALACGSGCPTSTGRSGSSRRCP